MKYYSDLCISSLREKIILTNDSKQFVSACCQTGQPEKQDRCRSTKIMQNLELQKKIWDIAQESKEGFTIFSDGSIPKFGYCVARLAALELARVREQEGVDY